MGRVRGAATQKVIDMTPRVCNSEHAIKSGVIPLAVAEGALNILRGGYSGKSGMAEKRPSFQFYPGDWMRDTALQSCSIAARGLWIELLCIAHDCEPYGWLAVGGVPLTDAQLARMTGVHPRQFATLKAELLASKAASIGDLEGVWDVMFSRRMLRDEKLRSTRAASGKLGGNPVLLNQTLNLASNQKVEQKPTPASASAVASASALQEQHKKRVVLNPPTPLRAKRPKPEPKEFAIPDWVPAKEWQDYVDMRLLIRKPIGSPSQAEYCIRALDKLRKQGHDPGEVLGQSVAYRWQGLFELKNQNGGQNGKLSYAEQTRRNAAIALERIEARAASAGRSE